MRAAASVLAVVLVAAAGCGGAKAKPVVSDADVVRAPGVERSKPFVPEGELAARAADDAGFGFTLQPHLGEPGANLIWSPYSVTHAFALAYAGARGDTRTQLARALRFRAEGSELHSALNALDQAIASRAGEDVVIATANAAWGLPRYPWRRAYLDVLARHHGTGMRTADFKDDPEGAAAAIDRWVRETTRDRIRDLFTAGDFDDLTRLVLANAAYLKAAWRVPFDPEQTRERPFHAPDGDVDVPTMHQRLQAQTATGDGWRAIELPYAGGQLALLVVVPDGALPDAEKLLGPSLFAQVVDRLRPEQVALALPRFEIESTLDLGGPLGQLGVRDAFDPSRADLSGMTEGEELSVAEARQKAFVSVDEAGTEAAAATGVVVGTRSLPARPRPFAVDRPFLFAIRDRPTGAVLFSGRVLRP